MKELFCHTRKSLTDDEINLALDNFNQLFSEQLEKGHTSDDAHDTFGFPTDKNSVGDAIERKAGTHDKNGCSEQNACHMKNESHKEKNVRKLPLMKSNNKKLKKMSKCNNHLQSTQRPQ